MKYTYHRGSENSQECVDFDLRRENGDYITNLCSEQGKNKKGGAINQWNTQ